MAIKVEMLRCFCTVAQTGNLAEASDRLGRTQSAISMTLKQLEEHLGKKLFEGERKSQLSALGEQVFDLAQKQLRQFDETVHSIETSASSVLGLIRVVSVPSVAAVVFPKVMHEVSQKYPGLKIELRDTDTQQVIDALIRGQADIGIASGEFALNAVQAIPLFEDGFGLVASPDHPLVQTPGVPTIQDVVDAGFVRNNLCSLIETRELREAIEQTDFTAHNTYSLIAMVRTGRWVTVLPKTVVEFLPEELVFRPIAGLPDRRKVFLYLNERTRFRSIAEDICELVKAQSSPS